MSHMSNEMFQMIYDTIYRLLHGQETPFEVSGRSLGQVHDIDTSAILTHRTLNKMDGIFTDDIYNTIFLREMRRILR